jgi:Family of unknown function (DUF6263)
VNWRMLTAAAAVLAVATSAAAQSVVLKYRWTKGDVLIYRVTLQTTGSATGVPGRDDVTTEQTLTQLIALTVDGAAPNGVATIHETVNAIRSEVKTAKGTVVVDTATAADNSKDPVADALSKLFGAVVGQSINMVLAPDGTVRSVEGGSRLLQRIHETVDPNAGPEAAASSQALTAQYSDQAIRTMLEQSFPKLPPQAIKQGDTWSGQLALGNPTIGRITAALTFTLKTVEGGADAERANVSIDMKLTQNAKPPASGPTRVSVALGDSHGEGDLVFDTAHGRIVRSSMRTDMPSTVSMAGPEGSPVMFKNRVKTNATMELVEK